jgi:phosphatidylglycerophosphate synthase
MGNQLANSLHTFHWANFGWANFVSLFSGSLFEGGDIVYTFLLLALVVVLVLTYGIKMIFKGKSHFKRVDSQGGSALLSKGLMEMAYWGLQPVGDLLIFFGFTPNGISLLSFGFGAMAGVALAFGHFGSAGFFSAISSLLDALDGMVARKTGVASDSGEVLDAAVDRYVEFFFMAGLIVYYRDIPWLVLLSLSALLGAFMVSYSTAKAEALHVTPPRGNMRRSERALYLTLGAVLSPISIQSYELSSSYPVSYSPYPIDIGYPMVFALFLVAIFANMSAYQRLNAIAQELKTNEGAKALAKASSEASAELAAKVEAESLNPSASSISSVIPEAPKDRE